jgi:hypothetical protein
MRRRARGVGTRRLEASRGPYQFNGPDSAWFAARGANRGAPARARHETDGATHGDRRALEASSLAHVTALSHRLPER